MSLSGARQDLQTIQQSVAAGSVVVASTGTGPFDRAILTQCDFGATKDAISGS